jgi:hypothetical protein
MNISQNENHNPQSVGILKMPAAKRPDLMNVGQDIYSLLNQPVVKDQQGWKKRLTTVEIKPDHLYSPREVAAILSASYDTAIRTMQRMKRTVNLAKPRAKKRLLRVKGSDLRDYINSKLGN